MPIIRSRELAEQLFPLQMVPQNWLINAEGRRSEDMVPLGTDDRSIESVLKMIQAAKPGS